MPETWQQKINWGSPYSIHALTSAHGNRTVIPEDKGYYVFTQNAGLPSPSTCLYLGIAVGAGGLRQRLASYLRAKVTAREAAAKRHRGKKLICFARIKGLDGLINATESSAENDSKIFVRWAVAPLDLSGKTAAATREMAFLLERALIDYYRPLYNTADWERDMDLELEDDAY